MRVDCELADADATRRLGARIAAAAAPGLTILLRGSLGAGKTTLADGLAGQLGAGRATSPSFVLAHYYDRGRISVWHLDLYRIETASDVEDLDLEQYFQPHAITLVEWPERADGAWPADRVEVTLSSNNGGRHARIQGHGQGNAIVNALLACGKDAG